jgi:hypothetical protein
LFASYIEKNADGWEAGIPENYWKFSLWF